MPKVSIKHTIHCAYHKFLASFQALDQNVQLIRELLAFRAALIRLASDTRYYIGVEECDFDWRKNVAQSRDEICLDSVDSNIVYKPLECDLLRCALVSSTKSIGLIR